MESLVNYESDGDNEHCNLVDAMAAKKAPDMNNFPKAKSGRYSQRGRDDETNYDDVTMDMSEDSNQSNSSTDNRRTNAQANLDHSRTLQKCSSDNKSLQNKPQPHTNTKVTKSGSSSPSSHRNKRERTPHREINSRNNRLTRSDDYSKHREGRERGHDKERSTRDRDRDIKNKEREKNRERHDRNGDCRSNRSDRDKRHKRDNDKDRRRNNDRKDSSTHHDKRASKHRSYSHSRSRSRSRSRERSYIRSEKATQKIHLLEKMGIELQTPDGPITSGALISGSDQKAATTLGSSGFELPKYYNPGVMNPAKYAVQMQKRKLLWSKKVDEKPNEVMASGSSNNSQPTASSSGVSKWGNTRFAQDADGKVASKFMRLMGIKDPAPPASAAATLPTEDVIKKQEEMFSTMEQQYEVARAVTHTMRGMGLGFGRQF